MVMITLSLASHNFSLLFWRVVFHPNHSCGPLEINRVLVRVCIMLDTGDIWLLLLSCRELNGGWEGLFFLQA